MTARLVALLALLVLAAPAPAAAAPALGAVAAQRVAEVLAAQERGGARQLSHLTLRLENAAGGEDRVRVDLRSGAGLAGAVGARIDVADIGEAGRLAARSGELRDALARHGLTADLVQVGGSAPPGAAPAPGGVALGDAAAAGGAAGNGAGNAAGSGSSSQQHASDRDAPAPRDPHARDAAGRDPRGGDPRQQQGRRAPDAWLDDEPAAPRRAR